MYIGAREPTKSTFSLFQYDGQSCVVECPPTVDELLNCLDLEKKAWINVNGLADAAVERLCERFDIHALVLEDIFNTEHRPKVESYQDYLFVIAKMLTLHEDASIEYEQVSLILTRNLVISIQETPGDCFDPVRKRLTAGVGRIQTMGSDYLLYSLLDVIVDNYFVVVENIGDRLEAFELDASEPSAGPEFMSGLQGLKRELIRMRKTIWPVRDSVGALVRIEGSLLSPELRPFLRDLSENTVQAIEALETYREHAASILEIYLSSVNNRMSQVMKVLTIISTIFIPLTFIAGVYGMNFERMPELSSSWGYPAVLSIMAIIAVCELIYFKFRKWI